MSFIEVPLLLKVQFGDQIRPYIMGGPTVGFLLSSKLESEIGGLLFKGDVKHITRKVDFGVGLGAGVSIPLGSSNIFLDGRYTLGLTDLNKGGTFTAKAGDIITKGEVDEAVEISTKGFQIMLGVAFPVGG
jgi:opacity protein-like surface antigen